MFAINLPQAERQGEDPTVPVAAEDVKRLPVNPQSKRFDKSAFVYDAEADQFHCPAGKTLSRGGHGDSSNGGWPRAACDLLRRRMRGLRTGSAVSQESGVGTGSQGDSR